MNDDRPIQLLSGGEPVPDSIRTALAALGALREGSSLSRVSAGEREAAGLFVVTEEVRETESEAVRGLVDETDAPILLLVRATDQISAGMEDFDDIAPMPDPAEMVRRARLLLAFTEARSHARRLGVKRENLAAELTRYGLDAGLAGPRGLRPPGRVLPQHLVDVDAVNRQQMALCRLMGTAYGTFLFSSRARGLVRPDGEEISPTGALSPYCAYLSAQGGLCMKAEYAAARRALLKGRPVETTCTGRVTIYSAPVCLSFEGSSYPLFAASVAVGGVPPAEEIGAVSEHYGVNPEILRQMAEESRFWVLNADKTGEIRSTFRNLAETLSREVSHKYGTAWQIFRSLMNEVELRHSRSLIAESNQALEEKNAELHAKNEEIYEVTHAITHDLRKPLSSLKATVGVLRSGRLGEVPSRQVEALETAWEATGYMNQLVDDLLEAARLDAGRKVLEIERVELLPLLEKIRRRLALLLSEAGIEVVFDEGLPPAVEADESALEKILMNLIGNAVSYIGDGEKVIRVTGESREGRAHVSVVDTGIGIPEESLRHVCEKFRRGANVSGIRGTGLGLTIVKGMLEAQGGDLRIESRVGQGTTVTFSLPVAEVPVNEEAPALGS